MKGMNANTGRSISGLGHFYQSIGKIVTTPLASCVKRRTFGSELPDLIDAPGNGAMRTRLYAAVATALMRWEPRLTLTRVVLAADGSNAAAGAIYLDIEGWTSESGTTVTTRVPVAQGSPA
ncbi:baseplate assembly protein [Burkholderia ubonensis]|uniref:Baseplate assembly protein n=1 Tax=Burkholderia ubonensis TaxID=101571 RepID=A0A104YCA7_9BURK|nr:MULTISPECIES: GPW/gp25 family protein [Burkholderia]AJX17744.1 lysozyme family protein [Burkholderia ubonensis MSMB22]KIP15782.1 25-like lysozyme family protein [Burkholderia sp. MSHR3999]KVA71518.1 baseplate assembly protein [Burkholderia ubonensis]KVC88164.1 baseplate assembly protein [Burkholderia ubonensis]KVD23357.1 baseplate assembly protein [Burkholderia ubonensis]